VMLVPLIGLALGAVAAGYVWFDALVGHHWREFWRGAIYAAPTNHVLEQAHQAPAAVVWAPLVLTAAGFFTAWYVYVRREGLGARIAARKGPLWTFLYNK